LYLQHDAHNPKKNMENKSTLRFRKMDIYKCPKMKILGILFFSCFSFVGYPLQILEKMALFSIFPKSKKTFEKYLFKVLENNKNKVQWNDFEKKKLYKYTITDSMKVGFGGL